jgi:prophage maintenance system killer protein
MIIKKIKKEEQQNIIIYKEGKDVRLDVHLENETIWLTQEQIAILFDTTKQNISQHLKRIFDVDELNEISVVKDLFTTAMDGKKYKVKFYNLDAIISIGYRVNSKRATQFRIWATKTLKDFIVKGYAINEKRLLETKQKFLALQNTISFLKEKSEKSSLQEQGKDIFDLLSLYSKTFTLLDQYDRSSLSEIKGAKGKFILTDEESVKIVSEIKKGLITKNEASELFGNERDSSFIGIIRGLYQTFGGKELYKSLESKAAHILYLIIKDHPFSDGNKRIASFLFVYFLDKNNVLYREGGEKKINDNTLVALALLIAESESKEKDQMIALITQLLI